MSTIYATVSTPPRGTGTQAEVTFEIKALNLTYSWGSKPATATVEYVASTVGDATIQTQGVAVGALVIIDVGSFQFYGICISDRALQSDAQKLRTLEFRDLREYLGWDIIHGAWNMVDDRLVLNDAGQYERRRFYWHILPSDWQNQVKTWTVDPYSASEIIEFCINPLYNPWGFCPWYGQYHADMEFTPVFNVDANGGQKLDQILSNLSDRLGMVFTLNGVATYLGDVVWVLTWVRKGEGVFPLPVDGNNRVAWTDASLVNTVNNTEDGFALNPEAPTHVRVVGGRNRWQLLNIVPVADWNAEWEAYYSFGLVVQTVFNNFGDGSTLYKDMTFSDDPERNVSRQMALQRAHEITVNEFADTMGEEFRDNRLYAGQCRGDMPVALYLRELLFRAYRLPNTVPIVNASGQVVNISTADGARVLDRLLVACRHDPVTGAITADANDPVDGSGYLIAQGMNVSMDFLRDLPASQFDMDTWDSAQDLWAKVEFRLHDAGYGQTLFITDRRVFRSTNLYSTLDGWKVPSALPTLTNAALRIAVVVEVDRFTYDLGDRSSGEENGPINLLDEPELFEERVYNPLAAVSGSNPVVIPYQDGETAAQKAIAMAETKLWQAGGPDYYRHLIRSGSFTRPLGSGTWIGLSGLVDRIEIGCNESGHVEKIFFTNERGPGWERERNYERRRMTDALFPGQRELKTTAETVGINAAALRRSAPLRAAIHSAYSDQIRPLTPVYLEEPPT